MAFITQAVTVLQTLVVALGAGLAVWGVINLMEAMAMTTPAPSRRVSSSSWPVVALSSSARR